MLDPILTQAIDRTCAVGPRNSGLARFLAKIVRGQIPGDRRADWSHRKVTDALIARYPTRPTREGIVIVGLAPK